MRALLLALLVLAPVAAAYPVPSEANLTPASACLDSHSRRFVYDYIGVFGDAWASAVEDAACGVYRATGAHFVVVAVAGTSGESLDAYATGLFESWGVGDAARDDGLLLLYVNDDGDGRAAVRVEVGYGLEHVVSSPVVREAVGQMQDAKAEALATGEDGFAATEWALVVGADFLLTVLEESASAGSIAAASPAEDARIPWWFWVVAVLVVLFLLSILARTAQPRGGGAGWGYRSSTTAWAGFRILAGAASTLGRGGAFGGGRSGGGGGSGRF